MRAGGPGVEELPSAHLKEMTKTSAHAALSSPVNRIDIPGIL